MATKQQISAVIRLIIPKVIEAISRKLDISIEEATKRFYNSETYKNLKDTETDLWTYSFLYIADEYLVEIGMLPIEQ